MILKKLVSVALIAISTISNSYSQNSKKDTVKKVSWAVRVAGGVNILRYKYPDIGDYQSHNVKSDGNLAQVGIKFSNKPYLISVKGSRSRTVSLTSELNYTVSHYQLNYTYYEYDGKGGIYTEANYLFSMHSAQLAILPKITIGTKKIVYISFGLFVSKPFFASSKGETEKYYPGYGSGSWTTASVKIKYTHNEIQTKYPNFNFGAIANFGVNFPIKKQTLCIEIRLQPGLTKTFSNPDLINYSPLLSASYSFW